MGEGQPGDSRLRDKLTATLFEGLQIAGHQGIRVDVLAVLFVQREGELFRPDDGTIFKRVLRLDDVDSGAAPNQLVALKSQLSLFFRASQEHRAARQNEGDLGEP